MKLFTNEAEECIAKVIVYGSFTFLSLLLVGLVGLVEVAL
jgi:hypothetical protein